MQRYFFYYSSILLLCLGAISTGLFMPTSSITGLVGGIGLLGWLLTQARIIAATPLMRSTPRRRFWSGAVVGGFLIILETGFYIIWASTPLTIFLTYLTLTLGGIVLLYHFPPPLFSLLISRLKTLVHQSSLPIRDLWLAIIPIILGVSMLWYLTHQATDGVLPSPWLAIHPLFFFGYGTLLFLNLVFVCVSKNRQLTYTLTTIQYAITFSVAAIIYTLGFGYDPLLHRASEQHIFDYGFVQPKTPFYLGQYILVNILAHITHLPIAWIDIWLVPALVILLIPVAAYTGLRYGFGVSERWARVATLLIPLYPLNTFYATTPHNLANVFTLTVILLSPLLLTSRRVFLLLGTIATAALVTHPLSGMVVLLFILGAMLFYRAPRWLYHPITYTSILGLFGILVILVTPAMFLAYFHFKGISADTILHSRPDLTSFLKLFTEPYYFSQKPVPWLYEIIYAYRWLIPPLLIFAAMLGFIQRRDRRLVLSLLFPLFLLINIFLVAAFVQLPELDSYQQLQYAERMVHVTMFFLLPLSLVGLIWSMRTIVQKYPRFSLPTFALVAVLITLSWYLTYPQQNPKVYFRGFNVTKADYEAAAVIHETTPKESRHIVLGNILVAGAAIAEYGFGPYYETPHGQIFYYSIPTGGPLYQQYLQMVYEGQKRDYMEQAMALTNADRAYFVLHDYWDNAEKIAAGAKQTANEWRTVGDTNIIWIFTYLRAGSTSTPSTLEPS